MKRILTILFKAISKYAHCERGFILNPFDTDGAFDMISLSHSINFLPNMYGRIGQMNLFPDKGVRGNVVIVEEQNGVLSLLPTLPRGVPGTWNKMGKRKIRTFQIPHIPLEDSITPSEYQGIRAFGSEVDVKALATVMNDHLQTARNKFDITLEFLRMGALKGIILDADGSVLYNLYTEFGITPYIVHFALSTTATSVLNKCKEVIRHIEDNLMGEIYSGVHCLCSAEFFDLLVAHAEVVTWYKNWSASAQMIGADLRKGFTFGGITFEEYRGTATDPEGAAHRFIASGDAHFYPEGTSQSFNTIYGPGDFLETVNTPGLPLYAKQVTDPMGRRVDVHIESNPLPMCYRPALLVKGDSAAS